MKAYVMTTGAVFGLLVLAHVWRVIEECRGNCAEWALSVGPARSRTSGTEFAVGLGVSQSSGARTLTPPGDRPFFVEPLAVRVILARQGTQ